MMNEHSLDSTFRTPIAEQGRMQFRGRELTEMASLVRLGIFNPFVLASRWMGTACLKVPAPQFFMGTDSAVSSSVRHALVAEAQQPQNSSERQPTVRSMPDRGFAGAPPIMRCQTRVHSPLLDPHFLRPQGLSFPLKKGLVPFLDVPVTAARKAMPFLDEPVTAARKAMPFLDAVRGEKIAGAIPTEYPLPVRVPSMPERAGEIRELSRLVGKSSVRSASPVTLTRAHRLAELNVRGQSEHPLAQTARPQKAFLAGALVPLSREAFFGTHAKLGQNTLETFQSALVPASFATVKSVQKACVPSGVNGRGEGDLRTGNILRSRRASVLPVAEHARSTAISGQTPVLPVPAVGIPMPASPIFPESMIAEHIMESVLSRQPAKASVFSGTQGLPCLATGGMTDTRLGSIAFHAPSILPAEPFFAHESAWTKALVAPAMRTSFSDSSVLRTPELHRTSAIREARSGRIPVHVPEQFPEALVSSPFALSETLPATALQSSFSIPALDSKRVGNSAQQASRTVTAHKTETEQGSTQAQESASSLLQNGDPFSVYIGTLNLPQVQDSTDFTQALRLLVSEYEVADEYFER